MNPLITLTTDFGLRDPYVGVMKGVILSLCPECRLIDLTHLVDPQNVAAGSFQLQRAVPYFPPDTVHLAVIDPGVGGARRALALRTSRGFFVGPDNGLLHAVASNFSEGVTLSLPPHASATFHGRDLFAPAAARLARGESLSSLGAPFHESLIALPEIDQPQVLWVDHFGNLITTVRRQENAPTPTAVEIAGQVVVVRTTYGDCAAGELLALFGSDGHLEIARNGGSAAALLGAGAGDPVKVQT